MVDTMKVSQIKVGKRHRRALGDVAALARDIDDIGLLQPIVVTPDGELIAGQRRLEAWKISKFKDEPIPVRVVDIASIVRGEASENLVRKDFTPSEMVAIARSLEASVRAASLERRRAGIKIAHGERGRSMDLMVRGLSLRRTSIEKARAIVEAAERDPALAHLVEQMDASGKVDGAFRALKRARSGQAIEPQSLFDVVEIGQQPIGDFTIRDARRAISLLTFLVERCEKRAEVTQPFREFIAASLVREAQGAADAGQ